MLFILLCISFFAITAKGQSQPTNLKTEYEAIPLGINTSNPQFSWQMISEESQAGVFQTATIPLGPLERG